MPLNYSKTENRKQLKIQRPIPKIQKTKIRHPSTTKTYRHTPQISPLLRPGRIYREETVAQSLFKQCKRRTTDFYKISVVRLFIVYSDKIPMALVASVSVRPSYESVWTKCGNCDSRITYPSSIITYGACCILLS